MPIQPRGSARVRPLLQKDIEAAQRATKSAAEASRYLNVNYDTYKKWAREYGIFERHKNMAGRGITRKKYKGTWSLESILRGEHPNYDRTILKARLIEAGYLPERCVLCGYNQKRELDGRCPLVLDFHDGNRQNHRLENLSLKCYNCHFQTVGTINAKSVLKPGMLENDIMSTGAVTIDDLSRIRNELMGE